MAGPRRLELGYSAMKPRQALLECVYSSWHASASGVLGCVGLVHSRQAHARCVPGVERIAVRPSRAPPCANGPPSSCGMQAQGCRTDAGVLRSGNLEHRSDHSVACCAYDIHLAYHALAQCIPALQWRAVDALPAACRLGVRAGRHRARLSPALYMHTVCSFCMPAGPYGSLR